MILYFKIVLLFKDGHLVLYRCLMCMQAGIEIPYIFVQTLIYGIITYAMIKFEWTAGNESLKFNDKSKRQASRSICDSNS